MRAAISTSLVASAVLTASVVTPIAPAAANEFRPMAAAPCADSSWPAPPRQWPRFEINGQKVFYCRKPHVKPLELKDVDPNTVVISEKKDRMARLTCTANPCALDFWTTADRRTSTYLSFDPKPPAVALDRVGTDAARLKVSSADALFTLVFSDATEKARFRFYVQDPPPPPDANEVQIRVKEIRGIYDVTYDSLPELKTVVRTDP